MSDGLVINDTTYSGRAAEVMLLRATFGVDTIQKQAVFVKDGIKKKFTIPRLDVQYLFQPRQATPTSQGEMDVDAKVLDPQDLMIYIEFNPRQFETHWYAEQLSPKLLDRELPQTFESFAMQQILNRSGESLETGFHMGSLTYTETDFEQPNYQIKYFDGFIKKALADAGTLQVSSPVALTTSNIRDKFQLAYNLVPKALKARSNRYTRLKLFVSVEDKLKYEEALRTDSFKNQNTTEKGADMWNGYELVILAGLPENTFYMAEGLMDTTSNMWIGMNSTEDNNVQLQRLQANSELFFFKALMKIDTQIGWNQQFVIYTTKILSDFSV